MKQKEFLKELKDKPIIALIFGSYSNNTQNKESDLDLLLIYNKVNIKYIENIANEISIRTNVNIQAISINFQEFRKSFNNSSNDFIKNLKHSKIILTGIEWWIELEQEETKLERMVKR